MDFGNRVGKTGKTGNVSGKIGKSFIIYTLNLNIVQSSFLILPHELIKKTLIFDEIRPFFYFFCFIELRPGFVKGILQ